MFKPNNNKYSRNKKNEIKKDSVFRLEMKPQSENFGKNLIPNHYIL